MVRRDATEGPPLEGDGTDVARCTGNAAKRFTQLDTYVWRRLRALRVKRKGRHLRPGETERWNEGYFHSLGLHRLRGTVRYPAQPFWGGIA